MGEMSEWNFCAGPRTKLLIHFARWGCLHSGRLEVWKKSTVANCKAFGLIITNSFKLRNDNGVSPTWYNSVALTIVSVQYCKLKASNECTAV